MLASIYDKTDKGREEIATRKHQLPNRLRPLLVLIDGKQPISGLLKKVMPLGLNERNLQELVELELITPIQATTTNTAPATAADITPVTANAENTLQQTKINAPEAEEVQKFQEIYLFFNETIKSNLGLRGFSLQLKAERANTLEDFENLRTPYLQAIMKSKGREIARGLRDRLDQLLYEGEMRNSDTFLHDE